jgi:hypothetical protein
MGPTWTQRIPKMGPNMGPSWARLGPIWGPIWGPYLGPHLGPYWGPLLATPKGLQTNKPTKKPIVCNFVFFARVQVSDHQPRVGSGYTLRETILAPVHETARVEKCCDSSGHRTTIDLGQSFQDIGLAVCQSTPSQSNPPGWVSAISRLSLRSWPREIESAAQPQRYLRRCYLSYNGCLVYSFLWNDACVMRGRCSMKYDDVSVLRNQVSTWHFVFW